MRPSIIMAMADYVKQQSEECLQKDKKVRRQTRVTRRQMIPPCVQASGGIYSAHLK